MKRILFLCHGNICRSPMAEFVMKDLTQKAGRAAKWMRCSAWPAKAKRRGMRSLQPQLRPKIRGANRPFSPCSSDCYSYVTSYPKPLKIKNQNVTVTMQTEAGSVARYSYGEG